MNTDLTASVIGFVSNNERVLRALTGIGVVPWIISGAASPLALFILSLVSVYLSTTAIIGRDPFYAASDALATSGSPVVTRDRAA